MASIEIESKPGQGTLVRLRFPIQVGQADAPTPKFSPEIPVPASGDVVRTRVLVVDDIDTNRSVLDKLLTGSGFEVTGVSGGLEAIEVFEQWKPDVILMDRAMPGMDGIETMERIRLMKGGRDVPIIFVTGGVLGDETRAIMAAGATDILGKPFRLGDLLAKIATHLAKVNGAKGTS